LSLYGNFYLMSNNFDLHEQVNEIHSKNVELSDQISSLTFKTNNLETKLLEPDKAILPESNFQNTHTEHSEKNNSLPKLALQLLLLLIEY